MGAKSQKSISSSLDLDRPNQKMIRRVIDFFSLRKGSQPSHNSYGRREEKRREVEGMEL